LCHFFLFEASKVRKILYASSIKRSISKKALRDIKGMVIKPKYGFPCLAQETSSREQARFGKNCRE
jgi:hypothetical protein